MQLGLWHLTLLNVRVLRNDSAAEAFSVSMAIFKLLAWGLLAIRVHYSEIIYTMASAPVKP
jgi:hypothetical protein